MAQLVARYLGVVEAVGSSPVTQTIKISSQTAILCCLRAFFFYFTNIAKYAKMHRNTSKYQQYGCQIGCQKAKKTTAALLLWKAAVVMRKRKQGEVSESRITRQ